MSSAARCPSTPNAAAVRGCRRFGARGRLAVERAATRDLGVHSFCRSNGLSNQRLRGCWTSLTEFPIYRDNPLTFKPIFFRRAAELAVRDEAGRRMRIHAGNGIVIGQLPDDSRHEIDRTMTIVAAASGLHGKPGRPALRSRRIARSRRCRRSG